MRREDVLCVPHVKKKNMAAAWCAALCRARYAMRYVCVRRDGIAGMRTRREAPEQSRKENCPLDFVQGGVYARDLGEAGGRAIDGMGSASARAGSEMVVG